MRKVGIKEFQANIKINLADLPFALTKRGKVVAYIVKNEESHQVLKQLREHLSP